MKRKLEFNYCECGCKCYTADIYHIYWDLDKTFTLFDGRFRSNSKNFSSMEEAESEAQERFELKNKQ